MLGRKGFFVVFTVALAVSVCGCSKKRVDRTAEFEQLYTEAPVITEPVYTRTPTATPEPTDAVQAYNSNVVNQNKDAIEQDELGHLSGKEDIREKKPVNEVDFIQLGFKRKHKYVEPSLKLPYRNGKRWYLVDTDGDFVGDSYWKLKKSDLAGKNGILYRFRLTDSNKKVDFIIPCQNYRQGYGEIIAD